MQNWLRDICKNHNTSLKKLGDKIGKSKQYMSELGRGNIRLTYDLAVIIAKAFEETPDTTFSKIRSKIIEQSENIKPTGTEN